MGDALLQYNERYSVTEWENWTDPWELIHGLPYCMSPAPGFKHQLLNSTILAEIIFLLKSCGKCKAVMPIDWQIDEQTVVQPDILVLCKPVTGKRLFQVPVCLFEILSPSTQRKDRTVKFELYQNQGVKYYVMVDPETKTTEAFQIGEDGKYVLMNSEPVLSFDFEGCKVELNITDLLASITLSQQF
jgi:Uma2 family endonuclease